jgi:hypothetical protein
LIVLAPVDVVVIANVRTYTERSICVVFWFINSEHLTLINANIWKLSNGYIFPSNRGQPDTSRSWISMAF